jgi:hypothetical protein
VNDPNASGLKAQAFEDCLDCLTEYKETMILQNAGKTLTQ